MEANDSGLRGDFAGGQFCFCGFGGGQRVWRQLCGLSWL